MGVEARTTTQRDLSFMYWFLRVRARCNARIERRVKRRALALVERIDASVRRGEFPRCGRRKCEDLENLPEPEVIAREIVDDLRSALELFEQIEADLNTT